MYNDNIIIDKLFVWEDTNKILESIKRLFVNRFDIYSRQDLIDPEKFPTIREKLTDDLILKSLEGKITIGIHQISNDDKIKWLCYDLDKKHIAEPKLLVDLIIKYIKEWYNLTGYVEKSGSPESYHIWIFTEPTDSEKGIIFNKIFLTRLKSQGIDIKGIEKGIAKGEKNLGCMIKLPFNIQRKNGIRSELFADIFKIIPEKLPVLQELQHTQPPPEKVNVGGVVLELKPVCTGASNELADIETCKKIIARNPIVLDRINNFRSDRSKLDFLVTKCLTECEIPRDTIYKFLLTLPHSKIHERGWDYFVMTYSNVIKTLSSDAYYMKKSKRR